VCGFCKCWGKLCVPLKNLRDYWRHGASTI
jgi:hypothetical protein